MQLGTAVPGGDRAQALPQDISAARGPALLEISLGREHRIRPKDIVGALAGETGIPGRSHRRAINIYDGYSTVEVPPDTVDLVIERMEGKTIAGVRLLEPIRVAGAPESGRSPGSR
jgi:ATP-dependent RNA helicase DeaD